MKGKITFLIGGILLFVYGALFLVNDIVVLRTLAPIEFPDDAIIISNWIDKVPLWGEQIFRYGIIVIPCFLIFAGICGIFGLWGLGSAFGMRFATLAIVLQAAMVGRGRIYLVPFYENLGSWLGFEAHSTSWCYWSSVLLLGFCIHIYLTGFEAAAKDEWNAHTITHSATRALFTLVFLPVGYVSGWLDLDPQIFTDLPPLLFSVYISLFILIFRGVRRGFNKDESPLRDALSTLGCIVALVIYYAIIGMAHSIIVDIYYLAVFMPGVFLLLILIVVGGFGKAPLSSSSSSGKTYQEYDSEERKKYYDFMYDQYNQRRSDKH